MKQIFLFTIFVTLSGASFAQNKLLSPKFNFDTTYQIIGLCHFGDKKMTHQKLTFLINDTNSLRKAQQEITYGDKAQPGSKNPAINLCIVKNKKIVDILTVMPYDKKITFVNRLDSILGTFEFDIHPFLTLSNKTPLNYTATLQKFKSQSELEGFIRKYEKNKTFLCYNNTTSSYEGRFQLVIRGSRTFKTPGGFKLIRQEFENNLVPESQYMMSYSPSFKDPSLLTYTIWTSKKNYDNFNLLKHARSKWQPTEIELLTYWLK